MAPGRIGLLVGFGLIGIAAPASAHMPYLLPNLFDAGERKQVTLEASFTEDAFRAEIAMNDAPFEITAPDGTTTRLAQPTLFKEMTIAEAALPSDGVYRLSSGQRLGRVGRMYREGAEWKMVGEGASAPAGVSLVDVQSTTLADAYVLRGTPGAAGALRPRGTALEIHPLGDPTTITVAQPFTLEILYSGKGLANAEVTLFREAGFYDGKKVAAELHTDASGKFTVTPPDPGRYLLLVRHRDTAPTGAATRYYSYSVTLAFEAL